VGEQKNTLQSKFMKIKMMNNQRPDTRYKTRSTYGPNWTDLTPLTFLAHYLKLNSSKIRPLLFNGKEQDYFLSIQGAIQLHIGLVQEISRSQITVDTKKAIVNHFFTLPRVSDYLILLYFHGP